MMNGGFNGIFGSDMGIAAGGVDRLQKLATIFDFELKPKTTTYYDKMSALKDLMTDPNSNNNLSSMYDNNLNDNLDLDINSMSQQFGDSFILD